MRETGNTSPLGPTREEILGPRRAELGLHHPLMTRAILFPTAPIRDLYLAIRRVVVLRETGCCFTAPSGVGKSCALAVVDTMLRAQMPGLCVLRHDAQNVQVPSIRAFFKHFLHTVRHPELRGETYDLRVRLVSWLVDEGRYSGLNLVVLMIDEAQVMTIQDFNFLKDVFNELDKEGVQLITIMMAQDPDFMQVIDRLKHAGRLDLIARFAMRVLPFRPFNSAVDLSEVLDCIDTAIYPDGSEITWTEFFFPTAFSAGFRLKGELNPFMQAITDNAPKSKPVRFNYPARQVFVAIRSFMLDNAGADSASMAIPNSAWGHAVNYAKVGEAMELMRPKFGDRMTSVEQ